MLHYFKQSGLVAKSSSQREIEIQLPPWPEGKIYSTKKKWFYPGDRKIPCTNFWGI